MLEFPPTDKTRILVVEDEADIQELLSYNLQTEGYEVKAAARGADGFDLFRSFVPNLVLLDVMLEDMSGIEVCRRIRADRDCRQPTVVMLTARGEEIDRVVGFEVGADDYVVKPFSVRELMLRVRAHLRARPADGSPSGDLARQRFAMGGLTIDMATHRVLVGDQEVTVSALEMRLLAHLAGSQGLVCTRRELLTKVWHYSPGVNSRTVDTHVKRLRDKLGEAGQVIHTVRGLGYRLG